MSVAIGVITSCILLAGAPVELKPKGPLPRLRRSLPVPEDTKKGDTAYLKSVGTVAGYTVQTLEGAAALQHPTDCAWHDFKAYIGTTTGLYVWDQLNNRIWRAKLFGQDREPVTGVGVGEGRIFVGTRTGGTVLFDRGSAYRVRMAVADGRGGYSERDGDGPELSGSLVGFLEAGGALYGAWREEGLLVSRPPGWTWRPLPMPGKAASAEPTCLISGLNKGADGALLCTVRTGERGMLLFSLNLGWGWSVISGFEDIALAAEFVGSRQALVGLEAGGAKLVDLKDGRTWNVAALAEAGAVHALVATEDGRIACGTETGFVLLSADFKEEARLDRKGGLAGSAVTGILPFTSYGKEGFILLCAGRAGRGTGGVTVLSRPLP